MKLYNAEMSTTVESKPRDCFACRLVGSVGLVGIGGYLGINSHKSKTAGGKYFLAATSFAFICLGVARYKQTYPFNKKEDVKTKTK